jgi:hypothetical protein
LQAIFLNRILGFSKHIAPVDFIETKFWIDLLISYTAVTKVKKWNKVTPFHGSPWVGLFF